MISKATGVKGWIPLPSHPISPQPEDDASAEFSGSEMVRRTRLICSLGDEIPGRPACPATTPETSHHVNSMREVGRFDLAEISTTTDASHMLQDFTGRLNRILSRRR